jgi:hypothetical protein
VNAFKTLGVIGALTMTVATAAHAAPSDACALLTTAKLTAILGAPIDPGVSLLPTHKEFCNFNETGKAAGTGRNAAVSILTERQFTLGKTPMGKIEKTPESGVGDEAYWSKAKGMVYILTFRKGSTYLRVQSRTNPKPFVTRNTPALDEQDKAADLKLAAAVLKKL